MVNASFSALMARRSAVIPRLQPSSRPTSTRSANCAPEIPFASYDRIWAKQKRSTVRSKGSCATGLRGCELPWANDGGLCSEYSVPSMRELNSLREDEGRHAESLDRTDDLGRRRRSLRGVVPRSRSRDGVSETPSAAQGRRVVREPQGGECGPGRIRALYAPGLVGESGVARH